MDQVWQDMNLDEIFVPTPNFGASIAAPLPPPPTSLNLYIATDDHRSNGGAPTAPVNRRHTRMMKNRESAHRSRARKQAYITAMLLKIDFFTKENAWLREEYKKLIMQHAQTFYQMLPEKHRLQRTKSALF